MGIREIASKAGVSIATVSRVLNNPELVKKDTRNKVMELIKESSYKKYNSFFYNSSNMEEIGVIMPNVINPFFSKILEGINKKSMELDLPYNLYLTNNSASQEAYAIKKLIAKNIKGVLFIRARNKEMASARNIQKLKQYDIPVVLIDRDIGHKNYSGVFLSNANATYESIQGLIKKGYKDIGIISGPNNNLNSKQRLDGYKKALKDNNIPIDNNLIYKSNFTSQSSFEITSELIQNKQLPEILFSCTNQLTIGCIKAIKQHGLSLKNDIKLFSFNKLSNNGAAEPFHISYIDHPLETMGEKSVSILKNKLVGTNGQIREILDYTIINRH